MKKFKEALNCCQNCLKISVVAFGESHPLIATYNMNIGVIYKKMNKFEEALEYFDKSLTL